MLPAAQGVSGDGQAFLFSLGEGGALQDHRGGRGGGAVPCKGGGSPAPTDAHLATLHVRAPQQHLQPGNGRRVHTHEEGGGHTRTEVGPGPLARGCAHTCNIMTVDKHPGTMRQACTPCFPWTWKAASSQPIERCPRSRCVPAQSKAWWGAHTEEKGRGGARVDEPTTKRHAATQPRRGRYAAQGGVPLLC